LTNSPQLRAAYNTVTTLKGLSGLGNHWDDEKGMNIGINEADAWNTYCMVRCINTMSSTHRDHADLASLET
jgi:hypothetical protein